MTNLKSTLILFILYSISTSGYGQIIQKTGYIYSEIASKISSMPSDSGNHYFEPDIAQLQTWENTLNNLLTGNYETASDSANTIGYDLIHFTDTFDIPNVTYYILETADSNYWGTYVYNPNYCRPLVIQSPHSKRDANTGHQGVHVFRKNEAMFYQVNGTHRCNSSALGNCTGTTTSCSSTAEPYRISDLAHTTQSLFQKTTEVLVNSFSDTHFIQLHGFTKQTSDPYVILSNGTQQTPSFDYMELFKNNLYNEDTVLTFKVAHIDTDWTRLRGFWNTQSRLVNNSFNACNANATDTNGRFFHIEQERTRLRSDVSGWNKVSNALKNTFPCSQVSVEESIIEKHLKIYPNPASNSISIEWEGTERINNQALIYNLLGQNMSHQVIIVNEQAGKVFIDLGKLPSGFYFIRLNKSIVKFYKTN